MVDILTHLAHALHASCHHDGGLSTLNGLSTQTHGLQPRATHHLATPRRDKVGDPSNDTGLACGVLPVASSTKRGSKH